MVPPDHSYAITSVDDLKSKLSSARNRILDLERQLRNAKDRERRSKKTIQNVLAELKENNLINQELELKLERYTDIPVDLFSSEHTYTEAQREFAVTLHLHGPKAYNYLRKDMHLPLPHPHTLARWLQSVDAKPGVNVAMIEVLKKQKETDPDKYGRVCLMIDAMAIKKHLHYDASSGKTIGFVDLGDGPDENTVASEALVFMVVGLRSHWKAPIAYFITRTLKPETQKVLVEQTLQALHEVGIKVVCMTMDGHATNVSMMTMLGCNLILGKALKPYFIHPSSGERVHLIMDACHMLKLARNMLHAYSPITGPDGDINWSFIEKLSTIQETEGLHLANHLSSKHVNFEGQKMKVSLAAQTLSNSVASALTMLCSSQQANFKGCEATIKFIQTIDRLFDMFNSRNPVAKGYKSAMRPEMWRCCYNASCFY